MAGKFVQAHLDRELHMKFAVQAAKEEKSIGALLVDAIKQYLCSKGDNSTTPNSAVVNSSEVSHV